MFTNLFEFRCDTGDNTWLIASENSQDGLPHSHTDKVVSLRIATNIRVWLPKLRVGRIAS
jgi:hypothetical protein